MTAASSTAGMSLPDMWRDILRMKEEMNAVLLAHYYQESEIQDLADFVGDSYELSRRAAETEAEVIVFSGVHFMAETAKILNPGRTVLLPDLNAGCSLAESAPAHLFRRLRREHPDHLAVTYINSSAEVKALSDIICTSSSAERILSMIPDRYPILFSPDKNLGRYVQKQSGREMMLWQGACTVHELFSAKKIEALRRQHPAAEVIAHPECETAVLQQAEYVGSTSGLLSHVQKSPVQDFIVATEIGILHEMQKRAPGKRLIPAPPDNDCACNQCDYMKLNTTEKLHRCMLEGAPEITLDEALRTAALRPIERMLQLGSETPEQDAAFADLVLPFAG